MNADKASSNLNGNLAGFDPKQIEPSAGFEVIPAGKYVALIVESEMTPNKSGNGEHLKLVFQIIEGEYKDRKLWNRLNLKHPNEIAVEIARRDLSAICHAVGVLELTDSSQLHGLPLVVKVVSKPRKDTGEMVNEIKGYEVVSKGGAPAQSQTAKNGVPWARR